MFTVPRRGAGVLPVNDNDNDLRPHALRALAEPHKVGDAERALSGQRPGTQPVLASTIAQFPLDGQDLLEAGASYDSGAVQLRFVVVRVIVDVHDDCTSLLELNGQVLHASDDGNGSAGVIELGDFAARAGIPLERVRVVVANNGAAPAHARYWLIGFVPEAI